MSSDFDFLRQDSFTAGPLLLGSDLVSLVGGQEVVARIVEVEAYDQADAASHSYRGPTAANAAMFGPSGHLYVYFIYGMHYSMNIVTGEKDHGAGLLVRAVQPLSGIDTIRARRGNRPDMELTNGPGKVAAALAVSKDLSGHDLTQPPLMLRINPALSSNQIVASSRVGISREKDKLWRFYVKGSPYVSRPH